MRVEGVGIRTERLTALERGAPAARVESMAGSRQSTWNHRDVKRMKA